MDLTLIKKNKLIAVTVFIYLVVLVVSREQFFLALQTTRHYLIEMFMVMPVVFLLTMLIDVWISREAIIRNLGEKSGLKGLALSVALGSLSAGPIYAAFPICKTLLAKGASVANIVVILSAWAVIKVPMLANEVKFLGVRFMSLRWVLTVAGIYAMGYVTQLIVKRSDIPQEATTSLTIRAMTINNEYCIGCGICARVAPEVYQMQNKKAISTGAINLKDHLPAITEAIEKCPPRAISWQG